MQPRIIIVEDDPDIQALLDLELRASGYDTAFARDGHGALALIQESPPDLILLDIGLPAGESGLPFSGTEVGLGLLEQLKSLPEVASIPIIVITASTSSQTRERALSLGAHGFIRKPFDAESLLATIKKAVPKSSA
ncbi:MAG: two-component system, OmpR family, alkaline phosphatase synthesis response regulator PhoP [Solirubrobacteraceae bacterium]|nr:two-component system, OmpR family, alkaline phosphatase synthesis response regulator PhoP [Solirubrobacteraceae bacterium]